MWNKESKLNAQTVEQKLEPIIQSTGCETVTQTQRRTERERETDRQTETEVTTQTLTETGSRLSLKAWKLKLRGC